MACDATSWMSIAQVLFNVLFPDWLQTALLTVLLLFVINKTVHKGIRQWQQESKAIKQRRQDAEQVWSETLALSAALYHEAALARRCHAGVHRLAENSSRIAQCHYLSNAHDGLSGRPAGSCLRSNPVLLTVEMAATILIHSTRLWQTCHTLRKGSL